MQENWVKAANIEITLDLFWHSVKELIKAFLCSTYTCPHTLSLSYTHSGRVTHLLFLPHAHNFHPLSLMENPVYLSILSAFSFSMFHSIIHQPTLSFSLSHTRQHTLYPFSLIIFYFSFSTFHTLVLSHFQSLDIHPFERCRSLFDFFTPYLDTYTTILIMHLLTLFLSLCFSSCVAHPCPVFFYFSQSFEWISRSTFQSVFHEKKSPMRIIRSYTVLNYQAIAGCMQSE